MYNQLSDRAPVMYRTSTHVCRILVLALLGPALPRVPAQTNMGSHVMEMQDEIPPEKLPPPVRIAGVGNAHLEITATPEAQIWFDQGLNLLHDYWDYESARAFEQSVRVDPGCAMCFWGLYEAESFYHSTAQGLAGKALRQATELRDHVSARERFYIDAAVAHEKAMHDPNPGPLYAEQQQLLQKLVKDYPTDVQARIFLANAGGKDSLAVLEAVLKDYPQDSAANHYYIHRLEASDHPEKALHSAEILGGLAPASGHMVHMPGHIFFRIGDYPRAEKAFADSLEVDERYMREQQVDPDNDWNYVHNLMYFVADLLEEGKFEKATNISSKITGARGKLESTLYIYSARDSISRLDPRLPVALRTADFSRVLELLQASTVRPGMPNLEFLRGCLKDFASAMESVNRGKLATAGQMSERLDAELYRMSQLHRPLAFMPAMPPPAAATQNEPPKLAVLPDALLDPLLSTLSIMSLELRGSLVVARGNMDEAKALFSRAETEEKALGYHEPPNYIRPVGETEGAAMLRARRWSDAKAAFEKALSERPHSGFALYGIAMANEYLGDREAASKSYIDFLAAWRDADAELPQIRHARAYLTVQPRAGSSRPSAI
jgi:tetratricopeptide (TPR) repeat protein